MNVFLICGLAGDGNEPVVPFLLSILGLRSFNHADKPSADETARKSALFQNQKYVERIAVRAPCRRNVTEIIGKGIPGGQHFRERENALFGIVLILISATLRCFDNDV